MKAKTKLSILPEDIWKIQYIENKIHQVMKLYNFKEIRTSLLQPYNLLEKTKSVIDDNEFNTSFLKTKIEINNNEKFGLRPNGTIAILDSDLVKLAQTVSQKVYHLGHEFLKTKNINCSSLLEACVLGMKETVAETEAIILGKHILLELGIHNIKIKLNNYGCPNCRPSYTKALKKYILENKQDYCYSCRDFLEKTGRLNNSCYKSNCFSLNQEGPKMVDFLCNNCKKSFSDLQKMLSNLMIKYEIDTGISSNFSYYSNTVFQYSVKSSNQEIILGNGGRYDILVNTILKNTVPAVGFNLDIDSIKSFLSDNNLYEIKGIDFKVLVYSTSDDLEITLLQILQELHNNSINSILGDCCLSPQQEESIITQEKCSAVIIIDNNLLTQGKVLLKNLARKFETEIQLSELLSQLERIKRLLA